MRRKELEKLKRINATPKMISMARNNILPFPVKQGEDYYERTFTTRYDMMIRCQTRGQYLMICLFFPEIIAQGKTTPTYEIYINTEGHEFETRVLETGKEPKWSTAKINNLKLVDEKTLANYYWSYKKEFIDSRIWINRDGRETLNRLPGTKESGWRAIKEFEDQCRDEQIRLAEEREKTPWDEDMKLVPEELPGFEKWSKHGAQKDTFIFYESVKSKEGYCSYCERMVPIGKPKHKAETRCKRCRRKAHYWLNRYRHTTSPTPWNTVCIQPIKDGFTIRRFENGMRYRYGMDDPYIWHEECTRYICQGNSVRKYEYCSYKGKEIRWVAAEKYGYGYISGKLYRGNTTSLKNGALKNSTVFDWKGNLPCESVYEYLVEEKKHRFVEQLVKIGMFRLAKDLLQRRYGLKEFIDEKKTDICGILRIDKARLKRLREMDAGINTLKWIQMEKMENTIYPSGMIEDMAEIGLPSAFGFLPTPHEYKKIWYYIKRQMEKSGETPYQIMTTWRDYYNMAEQEKWNVAAKQIGWPKDVVAAHMEVILAAQGKTIEEQTKRLEKKWTKVNEILPETKKFEFKKGKYQIVAATCIEDMVREGTALSHCIDKADFYYDRIETHEAYPFFLRKASHPDKPWYTLEVESSGNIRQKRTTGDNQNKDLDDAIPFLKEWQKYFKSKMTPEEVKYGILANAKRIEDYKQLRKDEKKVWHGKLAGKLLADVLEADFMEAM